MPNLSINDCGTAHENKLLEIYNDVLEIEKLKTGKDLTSLEKSKIEMQIAEAYQTILNNCKDGGSISQALILLEKRVTSSQVSVNEISKIAADVAIEVHTNQFNNIENSSEVSNVAGVIAAVGVASELGGNTDGIAEIKLPDALSDFDTVEMADGYNKTSELAEKGDENAQYVKGLINYSLNYLRIVDNDIPKGKETMVLTLIQNLSKTGNPAAQEMAGILADRYRFDVFSIDENGNQVFDEEKNFSIYRKKMLEINPKAADRIVDFSERKRDFIIGKGKESPRTYEENLRTIEHKKMKIEFTRKYNKLINAGEIEKAEELVRLNLDIAKAVLSENVVHFEEAQAQGNKPYMSHLQKVNVPLSRAVAQASKEVRAIDASKVGVEEVVSSVKLNPKSLIQEDEDREI